MTTIEELLKKPITELSSTELKQVMAHKKKEEFEVEQARKEEIDKETDLLVNAIVGEYRQKSEDLRIWKDLQIEAILNNQKRMYESLGSEPKESKTITYKTRDGKQKVVLEYADKLGFNNEAIVHIDKIKEIIKQEFKDTNPKLFGFVESILVKNSAGDYDPQLLTKARKEAEKLDNPQEILEEFDKLEKCKVVEGTSRYVRAYEKDKNNKWQGITLNFSAL